MNFNCPANRMIFDAAWLDTKPKYGDSTTYGWVKAMCDDLLKQMSLHVGLQGEVRSVLMRRMAQPPGERVPLLDGQVVTQVASIAGDPNG